MQLELPLYASVSSLQLSLNVCDETGDVSSADNTLLNTCR